MNKLNLPAETNQEHYEDPRIRSMLLFADMVADRLSEKLTSKTAFKSIPLQQLYDSYMDLHVRLRCKTWRNFERMYSTYVAQWSEISFESKRATYLLKLPVEIDANKRFQQPRLSGKGGQ